MSVGSKSSLSEVTSQMKRKFPVISVANTVLFLCFLLTHKSYCAQFSCFSQMLSLYYMQALFRDLRDLGYHQLAVPVVAMQQLIADLIFDNSQLKKLVHLRYTLS